MSNHTDARNWFQMALADVPRVERSFNAGDFADVAYRIQFCSEKIIKGILLMYGVQFKKFHEASTILHDEILSNPAIDTIESQILNEIVNQGISIETLSTSPRYGNVIAGQFTLPEDLFNAENIKEYTIQLIDEIGALITLLDQKSPPELLDIKEAFMNARDSLRSLVD